MDDVYDNLIPVHPVRKRIYNKFYDLLCKYNDSDDNVIDKMTECKLKKMSLNIERGIFNYTLQNSNVKQNTWNSLFQSYYMNRCVSIFSNLNSESYIKNKNLIKRLFNNEFTEFQLAFFNTKELFPEKYEYLSNKYNFDKKEEEYVEEIPDGVFQCKKCKSYKTTYYEMQTRSADESATIFVNCHNCDKKWKIGG